MDIPQFKGEIEVSDEVRNSHSTDASIFQIIPGSIFYPKDSKDVQIAINFARENNTPISVRAGGTCMSGGSLCEGIILNLTRHMNKVEIDPINKTATVEMGAMFRDIESAAKTHNLMFAPYTSSKDICGIGGMVGNNASGEKSIRHGATIDNTISLEVVLADGNIVGTDNLHDEYSKPLLDLYNEYKEKLILAQGKVPKVASGYRLDKISANNFSPIFVGAQGTLGIVTKAVLKLTPIPTHTRLLLIPVDSLKELPFILQTIMQHNPEGVETYDIHTFNRAEKSLPEEAILMKRFFSGSTSLIVLAQFSENSSEETDSRARHCIDSLINHAPRAEYIEDVNLQTAAWKIRRNSFTLLRDHNEANLHAVPCIEDIIVPIEKFDIFIPSLIEILDNHKIFYGFHGHIGDGALRVIPIIDFSSPNPSEIISNLCQEVFALVKSLGGNMSSDHSDGIIRSPFINEFYGEELYKVFVQIKNILDPKGILNPGKKVGGQIDYIKKYIKKA